MASTRHRRLVPCFLGILVNALIGKWHYFNTGVESSAAGCDCLCRITAVSVHATSSDIALLLTSNPELGPSPVSVSISAVNANVKAGAGAVCTVEFVPAGY